MNTWNGTGNVATAPTLRYTTTGGTPVINFNIGIRENSKDKNTTFVTITAWNKLAEACNKYVHKGDFLIIRGHLRSRTYIDKEKIKRLQHFIEVEQIEFDPRNAAVKANEAANTAANNAAPKNADMKNTTFGEAAAEAAPFGEQPVNQYEEDIPF